MRRSVSQIVTERLLLRQIDETDAESIVRLRSDESVYQYFLNPTKLTLDEHRDWYKLEYIYDNNCIYWIAVNDCTGAFVGVYGAKKQECEAEISYITASSMRHNGYAMEAVNAIIKWCTKEWQIKVALVKIHKENKASVDFAKGLGFKVDTNSDFSSFLKMYKICKAGEQSYIR